MPHRYMFYAVADPDLYDSPWRPGEIGDLVPDSPPPQGWTRSEQGPWIVLTHQGQSLPTQGWKIHVSATPDSAPHVATEVMNTCLEHGTTFKLLRSRRLVLLTQLKYADLRTSGKVATCYPRGLDELATLATALARALHAVPAAKIMGDVPLADSPVSLRYGAFAALWTTDAYGRRVPALWRDGALVPDVRGIDTVGDGEPSEFIARLQEAARERDARQVLDITDVRLLHRSNAGGVYRAQRPDGRIVVLKEARHHTGFDLSGTDAVTRLRHEHAVLERLATSRIAPRPVAYHEMNDSDILEMEFQPGRSLAQVLTREHPVVDPTADRAAVTNFLTSMDHHLRAAHEELAKAHGLGVCHGDVQPANIILTEDGARLIDWESASLDGARACSGVATPGYSDPRLSGPDADFFGLARCRMTLLNPLTPLLDKRPDLEADLLATGVTDLEERCGGPLPSLPALVPAAPPVPDESTTPDLSRLLDGIEASATPRRTDRLFPGDVEQFMSPTAGLGLLYGAAGIIQVLDVLGRNTHRHLDWLEARSSMADLAPSLDDGLGIALCLARSNRSTPATALVRRSLHAMTESPASVPWWRAGTAGQVLCLAELGTLLHDEGLIDAAMNLAQVLATQVHRPTQNPPGYSAGLLDGWAGVACALIRTHDLCPAHQPWLLEAALASISREIPSLSGPGNVLLSHDTGKAMPYLGRGAAAAGWAAKALLERLPADHPAREQLGDLCRGAANACAQKVAFAGGLLEGRAGLLAVLDRLTDSASSMIEQHRRRLQWYIVPSTARDPRSWGAGDLCLGTFNLRCSADLATGAAGLALALNLRAATATAAVLNLPLKPMTAVTSKT